MSSTNGIDLSSLKDKISVKLKKNSSSNAKKNDSKKGDSTFIAQRDDINKEQHNNNHEGDILRREALELGATDQDLKLIQDLPDDGASEQEFDDVDNTEGDDIELKKDLKKMMKSIGFDAKDIPTPEEEKEKEQEQEQEEEQEIEKQLEDNDSANYSIGTIKEEQNTNSPDLEGILGSNKKEKKKLGLITETQLVVTDKLLIPADEVWYNVALDPEIDNITDTLKPEQIEKLYQRGKESLEKDNELYYEEFTKNSSQRKFMSQILSDGTLNDKISALTLLVQESPIHNIKSLDTLLSYCGKKSRNSALQSLNALKDLFLNGLLPDRKLSFFKNQKLSMLLNKKTLAIYYFEDYLKKKYFTVLEFFEKLSHDPIIHVRMSVLTHIFDLLTAKPEQEVNLLRLGVNKLGDIDNKVSSKASFQLLQLEQNHPNMKPVIADAIIDISLKPREGYHTVYYAVLTLNQTILKRSEVNLANNLIKIYFTMFEKFLTKDDNDLATTTANKDELKTSKSYEQRRKKNFKRGKNGGKSVSSVKTAEEIVDEKNTKLFSAILTGLNRALPFSDMPAEVYEAHLDTLYKITHSSNFNTSIQALVLIFQVIQKADLNTSRYYRTLYESLLDPRLATSSKQGIYLNLLYKSLKRDQQNIPRVEAFVKRILQICLNWINIGAIAGMFYLLTQLEQSIPQLRNLFINSPTDYTYESENEEDVESTTNSKKIKQQYDPRKRDPNFAYANKSSLWEISMFLNHFHPTVQAYANAFQSQSKEITKPDLGLYTLAHFLDRFVYRNFKQKATVRGSSIMQPLGGIHTGSLLVKASDRTLDELPANTENWLSKKAKEIKPDEKFFYQYFINKKSAIKGQTKDKTDQDDDISDLDEEKVWDALVKSNPNVEGDDDEGEDDDDDIVFDDEEFSSMSENSDAELEESDQEPDIIGFDEEDASTGVTSVSVEGGDDNDEISSEEREEEESPKKRTRAEIETGKRKESNKKRKKALKELPIFASADDYAKYLQSDSDQE
ncbi:RNA-binding ribosome biosynthesis protein MAK21 SCDLUD_000747 [Saccharomycodes ludwigii]|uniref:RNA-binding ribosome biosynthesis protein MAK21 n=1 Tax=Saccharomycodes ludwigii TaxID=36035 RepID=UPI001E87FEAF|nr:hypothetical protein SCDLUD_000747 [Saccharomycodes ludwigii]KAH3903134.1 hypothetical protein SCDLUD_000747 [Saccharomycodes ludwigii]